MSKVKEIATHKASIWSYASLILGGLGYTGFQTVGAPVMDRVIVELNQVEDRQEISNKLSKELIILMKAKITVDNPNVDIDSLLAEVAKNDWWNRNH